MGGQPRGETQLRNHMPYRDQTGETMARRPLLGPRETEGIALEGTRWVVLAALGAGASGSSCGAVGQPFGHLCLTWDGDLNNI